LVYELGVDEPGKPGRPKPGVEESAKLFNGCLLLVDVNFIVTPRDFITMLHKYN
jgi:hypothetical protein